jgi:hypothetical protein
MTTIYADEEDWEWRVREGMVEVRWPSRPWLKSEYSYHFDEFIEDVVIGPYITIKEVEDADE